MTAEQRNVAKVIHQEDVTLQRAHTRQGATAVQGASPDTAGRAREAEATAHLLDPNHTPNRWPRQNARHSEGHTEHALRRRQTS